MVIYMSNKNNNSKNYWFRAMRYGWGWGVPMTWQGWAIFITYIGSIVAIIYIFPPDKNKAIFICLIVILTLVLIVIYWIKGEPLRWRWGKDKDSK